MNFFSFATYGRRNITPFNEINREKAHYISLCILTKILYTCRKTDLNLSTPYVSFSYLYKNNRKKE